MMHGYSLSASLPEDTGLGERFWYWRGASGQSYIHSIYSPELCPPVAGAVFVLVCNSGGARRAVATGRLGAEGSVPCEVRQQLADEIHVHLLARDGEAAERILSDLAATLERPLEQQSVNRSWNKPVQLELLAA